MQIKNTIILSIFAIAIAACNGPGSHSKSLNSSGIATGQVSQPDAAVAKVQQVRLRQGDAGKVLEYLDPSSAEPKWVAFGEIKTLPVGTQLHHWGPEGDIKNWVKNGINAHDIYEAVRRVDPSDAYGGGFYLSTSPVDSTQFGSNLLIAEATREITVLNLSIVGSGSPPSFQHDDLSLLLADAKVLIPVPLIADAGVDSILYSTTWMVCIRGEILNKLYEGNWSQFAARRGHENFNIFEFLKFATKYPISQEDWQRPEFREAFPYVVQTLQTDEVTEADIQEMTSSLKNYVGAFSTGLQDLKQTDARLQKLQSKVIKTVGAVYRNELKTLLADPKSDLETQFLWKLMNFHFSLHDIAPEYKTYVQFDFDSLFATVTGSFTVTYAPSPQFSQQPFYDHFYDALADFVFAKPDSPEAISIRNAANSYPTDLKKASLLNEFAKAVSPTDSEFREGSLIASGSALLDGPSKPGYLLVTEKQKEELESNPLLVVKTKDRKVGANGEVQYYVQYEYPNARNFRKFASQISSPELVQKLEAAEKSGALKSEATPQFAALNRELMNDLVQQAVSQANFQTPASVIHRLMRIHPFKNEVLNEKVIHLWASKVGKSFIVLDPEWFRTMTLPEFTEFAYIERMTMNTVLTRSVYNMQSGGAPTFDLNNALGIWEIAANRPPPHQDLLKFIDKVKTRFMSEEVQGWVKNKEYSKVYTALHEAGAD